MINSLRRTYTINRLLHGEQGRTGLYRVLPRRPFFGSDPRLYKFTSWKKRLPTTNHPNEHCKASPQVAKLFPPPKTIDLANMNVPNISVPLLWKRLKQLKRLPCLTNNYYTWPTSKSTSIQNNISDSGSKHDAEILNSDKHILYIIHIHTLQRDITLTP